MTVLAGGGGGLLLLASRGKGQSPMILRLLPRLRLCFLASLVKDESKGFFSSSFVYSLLKRNQLPSLIV